MSQDNPIEYEELKMLAYGRYVDAKVLFQKRRYDGAVYLIGYVVEASLKARICKNLGVKDYPDEKDEKNYFRTHNFDRLLLLSGLKKKLTEKRNKELFNNWSILTKWGPEWRYKPIGTSSREEAKMMLKALTDKKFGFITWIQRYW